MSNEVETLRTPEQMKAELFKLYEKEYEACQEEVNSCDFPHILAILVKHIVTVL